MVDSFWRGVRRTLPVMLGVIPFGIAYGASAVQHLSRFQAMGMSLIVFAGTAQFIAVGLMAQGASPIIILTTTALVNLRFLLMSAAFVPHLRARRRIVQVLLAPLVVDETLAVSSVEWGTENFDKRFLLGSGLTTYVTWQLSSLAGILSGPLLAPGPVLEFALPASLIGLLVLLVRSRQVMIIGLLAALITLLLHSFLPHTWSILIATIFSASVGVMIQRWKPGS